MGWRQKVCVIGALTYNLYIGFRCNGHDGGSERAQVKTVRWRLFQMSGNVVRHGRKMFLNIRGEALEIFAGVRERCTRITEGGGVVPESSSHRTFTTKEPAAIDGGAAPKSIKNEASALDARAEQSAATIDDATSLSRLENASQPEAPVKPNSISDLGLTKPVARISGCGATA